MFNFEEYEKFINKDSDDELLDRIRSGGMIYPSDLGYVVPSQSDKVFKITLKQPSIRTGYDKETNTMIVKQDIGEMLRDGNILAFADDSKLYFMNKTTLEIVSEFDRVK